MRRCPDADADLLLDGLPYQFTSFADAEAYATRLRGLTGAVFTPRARERWGPHMPVAPPEPAPRRSYQAEWEQSHPLPDGWEAGRRVETVQLPEEETP